ncbi:MAG TPA: ferrous iron transporter B [Phycisphaerales bacterium]|nr:ferrous iron transporter B [Phycisphaerales bacterium]
MIDEVGHEGAPAPAGVAVREATPRTRTLRVALLGNPNTGKTTLFNRLSGLRHKTANFPGTTQEARIGRVRVHAGVIRLPDGDACCTEPARSAGSSGGESSASDSIELIDLPGIYSLELAQTESELCRAVLAGELAPGGTGGKVREPDAVCVVVDSTNLSRGLMIAGEALRRRLPTVVALNMIDIAHRSGLTFDLAALESSLGCAVVACSARSGEGLDELRTALACARVPNHTPPGSEPALANWASDIHARVASGGEELDADTMTDRLDRAFTHPVLGAAIFAIVMAGIFWLIFSLATYPMDLIDQVFGFLGAAVKNVMPEGILRNFLSDGVVAGVGATVIFLPQICLLFFTISLLEDTGYLARAAFVMDRILRPFGLPGHSFVPLLSSHACALPGIMACRAVPDLRQRLATILVAPFMTCSARLPVYVLVTTVLFKDRPGLAALAFLGCYALGAFAGLFSALIARSTILKGKARPMALELPAYKLPSLWTALLTTIDRGLIFTKNAGTVILAICIVLWWLGSYPHVPPPDESVRLRGQAVVIRAESLNTEEDRGKQSEAAEGLSIEKSGRDEDGASDLEKAGSPHPALSQREREEKAAELEARADHLEASNAKRLSFAGQAGRFVQPVFAPLGYDWQLTIGVLSSFAAREVFVSTMAVVVTGEDTTDDEGILEQVREAKRDDGTPIFTPAVCWSILVFYVLAMQCLATLVVTAREAGGVKWALLQFAWMSGLAYVAAMLTYQGLRLAGVH